MKKLLFLIPICLLFAGCTHEGHRVDLNNETFYSNYKVVRIDGCQYLEFKAEGSHWTYTHKGNCDNPIHNK